MDQLKIHNRSDGFFFFFFLVTEKPFGSAIFI